MPKVPRRRRSARPKRDDRTFTGRAAWPIAGRSTPLAMSAFGSVPEMSSRLEGKVALASAAAAGIGEAVVRRFAAEGARLWLCDIDSGGLQSVVDDLRSGGAEADGVAGDAADSTFVDSWVAGGLERYGRVDVLYNGVGIARPALVADITDDDWRFQQTATLDSVFYATRAVLPHMVEQHAGSIVTMSSGAGIAGQYSMGAYGAAKAAVINLMETGRDGVWAARGTGERGHARPDGHRTDARVGGDPTRWRSGPCAGVRPAAPEPAGGGCEPRVVPRVGRELQYHGDRRAEQRPRRQTPVLATSRSSGARGPRGTRRQPRSCCP